MPLAAAGIGAAGSLLGGVVGGKGASAAAKAQAQEQQQALQLQQQEFGTVQGYATPDINAGNTAMQQLSRLLGLGDSTTYGQANEGALAQQQQQAALSGITSSPLYTDQFNSGLQGVDQSLAASGGLRGGDGALAQSTFGSNLFNQIYQQQISNLSGLTATGNSALGTLSSSGSNMVDQSSKTLTNLGNADATAAASPYAALASALSGLSGTATKYLNSPSSTPTINTDYTGSAANAALAQILASNAMKF